MKQSMIDFGFFEQFRNFEKDSSTKKDYSLERMRRMLRDFSNPQEEIACVHIAGSKGKGLTSAYCASILADVYAEPVGVYASPHVYDYRERIRFRQTGHASIEDGFFEPELYAWGIASIRDYLGQRGSGESATGSTDSGNGEAAPTTFELLTLLAFIVFKKAGVRRAVIEVGLGGRLDTTNVISPELCILTPLELEHCHILGNSIADIAFEKAGIIKKGVLVVSQNQEAAAEAVIRKQAEKQDAPLYFYSDCEDAASAEFRKALRLKAEFMKDNACLAYTSARILTGHMQNGQKQNPSNAGLAPLRAADTVNTTTIPGRFEVFRCIGQPPLSRSGQEARSKTVILDAAHTPRSIGGLVEAVSAWNTARLPITVLFSSLADKNNAEILRMLMQNSNRLIITGCSNAKRMNLAELSNIAQGIGAENTSGCKLCIHSDPVQAFAEALNSEQESCILVCGSFYLLGDVYSTIQARVV